MKPSQSDENLIFVTNLYVIKQSEIKRASGIPYSHVIHVSSQHSCEQENSKLPQKLKTREIELHRSNACIQ